MKKILSIILAAGLVFGLTACSNKAETTKDSGKKTTIKIGASAEPHAQILENVKDDLKALGYDLQVQVFTDYVLPNTALNDGSLDANYFQHIPYLEQFNSKNGTDLTWTTKVHIEPLGIYSNKIKNLKDISENAIVTIPNDGPNGSRALKLLQTAGLIKLQDKELVTKQDITENPKKLDIREMEAAQLPRTLSDCDISVINTNYALPAGLNPVKDALILESSDSPYANIIAVKTKDKNEEWVKALDKVLTSEKTKKFIEEKYNGSIIAAF